MKELSIIICDSDAAYAKALVQAFQRKKAFEANYIILTDKNKLISYVKEDGVLLYIISEEAYEKTIVPYSKDLKEKEREEIERRIFVLTDSAETSYEMVQCIFKYQPANAIIEPVNGWLLENYSHLTTGSRNVKIIGVMDYAGGGSPALLGHLIGKMYSETKQVLLVNMELFPFQFGLQKTEYTLSDYIYAASTGSDCIAQVASGMQYMHGALHCVSPIQCFEDLYELRSTDVSCFLKQLKEQSGCEIIVLVFDFLRPFALELLSGCDAIISREIGNRMTARKREQLQQMLALEQKEWLLERMSYCSVDNDYLLANISEDGEISSQAKTMFYEYLATLAS